MGVRQNQPSRTWGMTPSCRSQNRHPLCREARSNGERNQMPLTHLECQGRGKIVREKCSDCGGRGQVRRKHKLEIKVPAGVERGTRLRITGAGEAGVNGGPQGDLYLLIDVKPDKA